MRLTPTAASSWAAPTGSSPKIAGEPALTSIGLRVAIVVGGGLPHDVDHLAQLGGRSLAGEEAVAEPAGALARRA